MAGHSKFKNIMHRKGAQDEKRAKIFTKAVKEIIVAAKSGLPDPKLNNRLRNAIVAARAANLPNDRIDAAIKKASSNDADSNYDEINYEGYGPCGVAFIIEAQTNNRNRTAGEVRSVFTKCGGNLGETGSVGYMFKHQGEVIYHLDNPSSGTSTTIDPDELLNAAMECAAEDCLIDDRSCQIITTVADFHKIREQLEQKFGEPAESQIVWAPLDPKTLNLEEAQKILKFMGTLDDNDDVREVYGNFVIPDDIAAKIT